MVRDMELVRKILLQVRDGNLHGSVDGFDTDTVNYHKALLVKAELLEGTFKYSSSGQKPDDIPTGVRIKGITWQGHDFVEAISTNTKWEKVKSFLIEGGKDKTLGSIKIAAKQLFGFG
jgi:hypothetical protein